MEQFIPKLKKKDFTLHGYNYLGAFNDYSLEPVDVIDFYAKIHDMHYDKIIEIYGESYPYLYFNSADSIFITNLEALDKDELNDVQKCALAISIAYFKMKQLVFPKIEHDVDFDASDEIKKYFE